MNDFPPAGEAGGKIIDDFLNGFPPAGEAGGKIMMISLMISRRPGRPVENN